MSEWIPSRRDPTRIPAAGPPDLVCVECGTRAPRGAPRWRAYLTAEDDGGMTVAFYCADCAEREFGADT